MDIIPGTEFPFSQAVPFFREKRTLQRDYPPRRVQQHLMRQAGERYRSKRSDDPVAAGKRYPEPFRGGFRKRAVDDL